MKFKIIPPNTYEAADIKALENHGIEVSPIILKGSYVVPVAYVTAEGVEGSSARAVVMFNGRTALFTVQQLDGEAPKLEFDLPREEFDKLREKRRRRARNNRFGIKTPPEPETLSAAPPEPETPSETPP